jgi:hypothetical protein
MVTYEAWRLWLASEAQAGYDYSRHPVSAVRMGVRAVWGKTDMKPRKAADRERKRKAKAKEMRGYARQSIAVIAPQVGVKKKKAK